MGFGRSNWPLTETTPKQARRLRGLRERRGNFRFELAERLRGDVQPKWDEHCFGPDSPGGGRTETWPLGQRGSEFPDNGRLVP